MLYVVLYKIAHQNISQPLYSENVFENKWWRESKRTIVDVSRES